MGVLGVINSTPFWATQPGQPPLSGAPASPAAYGEFAGEVADRCAGKVGAYEIWNDPDATVIGGVVGSVITYGNLTMNPIDFVDGIYSAGGQPYFDALSFHPYQYTSRSRRAATCRTRRSTSSTPCTT